MHPQNTWAHLSLASCLNPPPIVVGCEKHTGSGESRDISLQHTHTHTYTNHLHMGGKVKGSSAKSRQSTPIYFLTSRNPHGDSVTLFDCQDTIQLRPAPQPVRGERKRDPQDEDMTREDRQAGTCEGEREDAGGRQHNQRLRMKTSDAKCLSEDLGRIQWWEQPRQLSLKSAAEKQADGQTHTHPNWQ